MSLFADIPEEMKRQNRWVMIKTFEDEGHTKKVPMGAPGRKISSADSSTWFSFDDCCKRLSEDDYFQSIAFALGDGFCAIDMDNSIVDGEFTKLAENVLGAFDGTYAETSISGKGLHIFFKADFDKNIKTKEIEIYSNCRFITITGKSNGIYVLDDKTAEIQKLYSWVDKPRQEKRKRAEMQRQQADHFSVHLTDSEVIEKALHSKNGNQFSALMSGDWQSLNLGDGSQSCADYSLCAYLAFWCGCNADQMCRIFQESGLYRNERKMKNAVLSAIRNCRKIYTGQGGD